MYFPQVIIQTLERSVLCRCCKIECRQLTRKLQSCRTELNQENLYKLPKNRNHNQFYMGLRSTDTLFQRQFSSSSTLKSGVQVAEYEEIKDLPKHPEKLLVDVREPSELAETGTIPTSINIPLGEITKDFAQNMSSRNFESKYGRKKPNEESEIIFSCKSGVRSRIAAESVLALGYQNVKSYDGSWTDWAQHEDLKT